MFMGHGMWNVSTGYIAPYPNDVTSVCEGKPDDHLFYCQSVLEYLEKDGVRWNWKKENISTEWLLQVYLNATHFAL